MKMILSGVRTNQPVSTPIPEVDKSNLDQFPNGALDYSTESSWTGAITLALELVAGGAGES